MAEIAMDRGAAGRWCAAICQAVLNVAQLAVNSSHTLRVQMNEMCAAMCILKHQFEDLKVHYWINVSTH